MQKILNLVEAEAHEIEHIENLLGVLSWLMDDIPEETDKERAWKLEYFCQCQGMTRAVQRCLHDICISLKEKNEKLLNMVDTMRQGQQEGA